MLVAKCVVPIIITKSGEVCFSIWFWQMFHPRFTNATWYFLGVNLISRSWRTWKTNQITPTYLILPSSDLMSSFTEKTSYTNFVYNFGSFCHLCFFLSCLFLSIIFKILIEHIGLPIDFTIECGALDWMWRRSPISFTHLSLWCLFCDLTVNVNDDITSNLGVRFIKVAK